MMGIETRIRHIVKQALAKIEGIPERLEAIEARVAKLEARAEVPTLPDANAVSLEEGLLTTKGE